MRFWVTKNSEVSVREQLVRQVILAILSYDLPAGRKLPSTRSIARRYKIHANTVSAAYHHLLEQGWLELRRGSGLYVRNRVSGDPGGNELGSLLSHVLLRARELGHAPEDVLSRMERLIHPAKYRRIVVAEPEPAMRAVLAAEIGESLSLPVVPVGIAGLSELDDPTDCLIAVLPTRVPDARRQLAPGTALFEIRLRSVRGSLEGQTRPGRNAVVTLISASEDFRRWARAMLIAVGIEPDCLCEVDTADPDWQQRARSGTLAIADVVAARMLPAEFRPRVFRVIADEGIAEMKQLCAG